MSGAGKWMKLYPSDWLAGTRGLSPAECGIYITLICLMYEREAPLPRDEARLARQCGMRPTGFRAILAKLIALEKVTESPDGLWNDRVAMELTFAAQKSSAAKQSAGARWRENSNKNKGGHDANALPTQSVGMSERNADHDHIETPMGPKGHEHAIDLSGMSRNIRDYASMGISRDAALAVQCQQCGAEPGAGCAGIRGQGRDAPHFERYQLVAKLREAPAKADAATLPVVREGDPIVPFLAKVRGREILFGTRGTVTTTTAELDAAKAMAGAA